jgi:acyl dehydratase
MYQAQVPPMRRWSQEELTQIERVRHDWLMSHRLGVSPHFEEVKIGDRLPRRALGPHTLASFATEYRAFLFNVWGSYDWVAPPGVKDPWINQDPGWVEGFGFDEEGAKIDPRKRDGLYLGPSRGHVDTNKATEIGMPRAYGYGATMGAWVLDYLGFWAGNDGLVRHSKARFQEPPFEGDVTYTDGEVIAKEPESAFGAPLVTVKLRMTNQDGGVILDGTAELELPV